VISRSLGCRWKLSRSRLVSGPLTDASFHLLVRDDASLLDVALGFSHSGEKCNFLGGVTVIAVIRQPVDRLKNLIFNAHG
jgi:hypothetical protein